MSRLTNPDLESQWSDLLADRMVRHNKDLRLICQDGSLQMDAMILMMYMKHWTSSLGQALIIGQDFVQTLMLPNTTIWELHQFSLLLHQVEHTFLPNKVLAAQLIILCSHMVEMF